MNRSNLKIAAVFCSAITLMVASSRAAEKAAEKTVKVFILAGQSNMVGKATVELMNHQAQSPKTKKLFTHLRKDGKWIVRNDVLIRYQDRQGDRKGGLTVGYGNRKRTGVELEFGTVLGDDLDEPVLLIKTAWGGHSLFKLFRSPSAGMPTDEKLQADLEQAQKRTKNNNEKKKRNDPLPTMDDIKAPYGSSYRKMMTEVNDTLKNCGTLFPELKGKKLEVAGFVWFQGWNDQYGAQDNYASNMQHFIKDVRKDFGVPKLPFVIGVMGQNGSKPAQGPMLTIQKAQIAMESVPEFKGNVRAVRTDILVDKAAEKLYPTWRKNFDEWKLTGSDFGYHYMGSAIWFNRIGHEMGKAMLEIRRGQ